MLSTLALLAASATFDGVIGLSQDGKTINLTASGWADPQSQNPLTVDSQFPICSISKLFTSALVMGFVEEGRLSRTDTAGKFLPWLPDEAKSVTVDQLLFHASGLPNMDEAGPQSSDGVSTFYFRNSSDLKPLKSRILAVLASNAFKKPGAEFSYNNLDYLILEAILESCSGKKFGQLMSERVLQPLGMKSTKPVSWGRSGKNLVVSYDKKAESRFNLALYGAAGGWSSTAKDLLSFGNGLLNGKVKGAKLLFSADPQFGFVGPGGFIYDVKIKDKNFRAFDRGGEIANFCHDLLIIPEAKSVLIILSASARSRFQLAYTGSGLPLETLQQLKVTN